MLSYLIKKIYFHFARLFFNLGYFPGSSKLQGYFTQRLPLQKGLFAHPLGFTWPIYTRNSLKVYISSCEPYTTKILMSRSNTMNSFVCVGANLGWYPLLVGTQNREIDIYAFECHPMFFNLLEINMANNGIDITCSNFAISDLDSRESLYMPKDGNDGMSTLYPAEDETDSDFVVAHVALTSLDAYFGEREISKGEVFILMDIEGGELKAIEGGKAFLEKYAPTLILEINPKMLAQSNSDFLKMFRFFQSMSYDIYWIDEREDLIQVTETLLFPHTTVLPIDSGANYLFVEHGKTWVQDFIKRN
jgi:FkbM family methyltransferase